MRCQYSWSQRLAGATKSPLLSRCMFCNIPHLLQILCSVSAPDTRFLYCGQSKHILGMDGANHNIFTEQPCPTADSPSTGSSRASIIAQDIDTIFSPLRLCRSALTEGGRCVCSPHSCRSLWWCRQRAPPLILKRREDNKGSVRIQS